ncbi:hypothetical protein OG21DRAFT_1163072 [Imleria badia]|nr:hypothetical protein OG21DRAFT_1163072 [Imleria badia]
MDIADQFLESDETLWPTHRRKGGRSHRQPNKIQGVLSPRQTGDIAEIEAGPARPWAMKTTRTERASSLSTRSSRSSARQVRDGHRKRELSGPVHHRIESWGTSLRSGGPVGPAFRTHVLLHLDLIVIEREISCALRTFKFGVESMSKTDLSCRSKALHYLRSLEIIARGASDTPSTHLNSVHYPRP